MASSQGEPTQPEPSENPAGPRVLIADDEAPIRRLVKHMLRRAGFESVEAVDGQEAIEELDGHDFDALVLDLMMPRMDGFGVIEHLIQTNPRMVEKTVVLTAFSKAATKERIHHVCTVLSKPFEMEDLLTAVRECARR